MKFLEGFKAKNGVALNNMTLFFLFRLKLYGEFVGDINVLPNLDCESHISPR